MRVLTSVKSRLATVLVAISSVLLVALVHPSSAHASPEALPTAASSMDDVYGRYSEAMLAVQSLSGSDVALAILEVMSQSDGSIAGVCHAIAHDLGHAAFASSGDAARALTSRNDVCGGGYIHGVIERALATALHPRAALQSLCAPAQDGICWHGLGHGAMFVTKMNVAQSLGFCDQAPRTILRIRCSEGVFMQLFNAESAGRHGMDMPLPSLVEARQMCLQTRTPYAANCWFYAPNVWLAHYSDDFIGAMGWCAQMPVEAARTPCARGVGSRTVKRHLDELAVGEAVCATSGSLRDPCLAGMGSYWSVHWGGAREPISVCDDLIELQDACRRALRV